MFVLYSVRNPRDVSAVRRRLSDPGDNRAATEADDRVASGLSRGLFADLQRRVQRVSLHSRQAQLHPVTLHRRTTSVEPRTRRLQRTRVLSTTTATG